MSRLFTNARIFTSTEADDLCQSLLIRGNRVVAVGSEEDVRCSVEASTEVMDLHGAVVLPGLIDAHTHLVMFGASMTKIDMMGKSAKDVQQALIAARLPHHKQLLGKSFLFDALGQPPHRAILDAVIPDIPVFIDSADLHSCWLNSKALELVQVTSDTPDPVGGTFVKDEKGELTGLFLETAVVDVVWPYIANQLSLQDRLGLLKLAFDAYLASGVTGVVDMAMELEDLEALEEYDRRYGLPLRVAAHWIISPGGTPDERLEQVQAAARHRDRLKDVQCLSVIGIKIISDGVVDSCTAYLSKPYANGKLPDPIWPIDKLRPVVLLADQLSLQIAVHAIGDAASAQALDVFEHTIKENPARPSPRFRIEHLEVVSQESIERLTRLGVVASLQPVHADPVYVPNWRLMLGEDERCDRAFPWTEYAEAHVAFGSDAPTAPHHPFPNLYTATTRRSGVNPNLPPSADPRIIELDRFNLKLETAIRYYTTGSAYSIRDALRGELSPGKIADFCVISVDPFANGVETLKQAQTAVQETWVGGEVKWRRAS